MRLKLCFCSPIVDIGFTAYGPNVLQPSVLAGLQQYISFVLNTTFGQTVTLAFEGYSYHPSETDGALLPRICQVQA